MIVGPGIITANVDNDAGGIATYSVAGARFGYRSCGSCSPPASCSSSSRRCAPRMGVVTGKGLSALIRERFGLRVSFYLMLALVVTNIGNAIADFAGVAASARDLRDPALPRRAGGRLPPLAHGGQGHLPHGGEGVLRRLRLLRHLRHLRVPRPARTGATAAGTSWCPTHGRGRRTYALHDGRASSGTTIAPWMQFYQQASVVEKGIPLKHYRYSRLDTILGAVVVTVVCYFIVVACAATLHRNGDPDRDRGRRGQGAGADRRRRTARRSSRFGLLERLATSAPRSCPSPPPPACARPWAGRAAWTSGSPRRRSTTSSTRVVILIGARGRPGRQPRGAGPHHAPLPGRQRRPPARDRVLHAPHHQRPRPSWATT